MCCRRGCCGCSVWRQLILGHVRHPIVLLPLHAPVLKPDLDLSLGETELVGDLDASPACQVPVEVELLLEFECLMARVRRTSSLVVAAVHAVNTFTTITSKSALHSYKSSSLLLTIPRNACLGQLEVSWYYQIDCKKLQFWFIDITDRVKVDKTTEIILLCHKVLCLFRTEPFTRELMAKRHNVNCHRNSDYLL